MDTDICEYYLKSDNENEYLHLGVVISQNYRCSDRILNKEKNGVDLYSMTSMLWKGFQEQQEQIEYLQKELKELKGEKQND